MLKCKICHEKIKKGEMYEKIIGEEAYLCLPCSAASFVKAIYERPIASFDTENKKYLGRDKKMRAKRVCGTFDNLEYKQVSLDLENIVIENVGILEVALNKGQETKKYWINVLLYRADAEQNYGGEMIYQSENFKSKKKAKKEYNKISKSLENGNHVLKSDLNGNPIFKYMGKEYGGEYAIHQFARMLRESLDNYKEIKKK